VAERLVDIQGPRLAVHALNDLAVDADSHAMLGGGQHGWLLTLGSSTIVKSEPANETPYSISLPGGVTRLLET
jgi:hypothetical protein